MFALLTAALAVPMTIADEPAANWKLANQFSQSYIRQYVYSTTLTPNFINKTDEFWYSWRDSKGVKFWRVNPKAKRKLPLFDSAKLAAQLSELSKKPYDTTNLPVTTIKFDEKNDKLISFNVDSKDYEYDTEKETLKFKEKPKETPPTPEPEPNPAFIGRTGGGQFGGGRNPGDYRNWSPDKSAFVYAQDHNLYYVQVVDKKEQPPVQLSKDGVKDYSYGARGEFGGGEDVTNTTSTSAETKVRASVTWSKDSKRFFGFRFDQRKVRDLYLVNSLSTPRPTLLTYKYSMPGEVEVPQQELFYFEPETKTITKANVDKWKDQRISDAHFQDASSDVLRFVRRDRLQRNLDVCDLNLRDKKVTPLLTESVENAFLEVQQIRYLKPGGDFIWWSERTGWGHFYLYSNDGKLKHAITSGAYRASTLVDVDPEKNKLWFASNGREEDENPYYRHLYRVNLDGKDLTLLDKGDADHNTVLSTSKEFAVDVFSRTDLAPQAVVRDKEGNAILELEKTDLSRLYQTGWKMPRTFEVKAADGVTDIYGNMWLPFDFDPKKKYPIIANVYPGPQTESVTTGFSATAGNQRLAQLGFVVIQIGNRGGNPARSNAYHSYGYYNLRDYGLADKKAGIEQLAAQNPWIDGERVGIYGHSGGGFMTAAALLLPPFNDFFKVGVSSAGNHDNNIYNQNWSEQHHGLREVNVGTAKAATPPPAKTPDEELLGYDPQFDSGYGTTGTRFDIKVPTNAELAANLKGKLLLVHGDMDNNVHPGGTIRLVDALIKANKRFDMLILPGKAHGFADMQPYFTQVMYEYFVKNLMGAPTPGGADMIIAP